MFAVSYSYDSLNRLTNVDYGNGPVISYTYDAAGNRLSYGALSFSSPHANFTASPTNGAVPLAVNFVDTSTGTVTNRTWNFGDNGSSIAANVIHAYNSPGLYSVSLSVFGPGGSDTVTRGNLITATNSILKIISPPAVTNTLGVIGGHPVVKPGQSIGFTGGSYDDNGSALSCLWNFGDGGISTDCNPSHVFTNCGSHGVSVTVGDGFASVSTNMTVAVACPLTVSSLKLQVKFNRVGSDACAIKGALTELPSGFSPANAAVTLNVGDAQIAFQLDAKGRGVSQFGKITFKYNKKTGAWTFTGKLKGDWRDQWANYGLANGSVAQQAVTLPVLLTIGSSTLEAFEAEPNLSYTAREGKSGTAR